MVPATGQLALLALGILLAVCQALENSTSPLSDSPVAAAVVSHFNKCPDSHTQYCFHGTCRFLVQEEKPACVGLKIPEEEFGQVAYDSPTKKRHLGTTPLAVPRPMGHAGRPSPSVHNCLGRLLP
ncbi:protransforming growth factor alpha isoform 2 preproprotein [Mus musculus]|nr:protransforming growth factor alpha isoform 2 preproprotein [Mus musculus]